MSVRGEMWVHGNSVAVQFPGGAGPEGTNTCRLVQVKSPGDGANIPWTDLFGLRTGPGARFRANAGNRNWFHFSIPTPAVVPDLTAGHVPISVDAISVYYSTTDNDVFIGCVEVFSGSAGDASTFRDISPDRRLTNGDRTGARTDGGNFFPISPLRPQSVGAGLPFAIGISVLVNFDVTGEIMFTAAGIHFSR